MSADLSDDADYNVRSAAQYRTFARTLHVARVLAFLPAGLHGLLTVRGAVPWSPALAAVALVVGFIWERNFQLDARDCELKAEAFERGEWPA